MPIPPIPPPLEQFGSRPFSFYPPILNVDHNEWRFVKATWSEILVANTATHAELWVPRRFLGEVSRIDEPVMIVGLTKELEYKSGAVWPAERRVIEMPKAVNDVPRPPATDVPRQSSEPVVGIRLDGGAESRIGKLILGVLAIGIVACVVVVAMFRGGPSGKRVTYAPVLQSELGLTAHDDYFAIKRKLGEPASDHWKADEGELQYRVLEYPDKGLSVILMGTERERVTYIGAMDKNWKVVHSVRLPSGTDSRSMLMQVPRF
jgi:hypothetical protein